MLVVERTAEELKSQLQWRVEVHDEFFYTVIIPDVHVLDVVAGEGVVRGRSRWGQRKQQNRVKKNN